MASRRIARPLALLAGALLGLLFASAGEARVPAPYDWSHRHLVFANPDTLEEAYAKGEYLEWLRLYRDPRFVLALLSKMEHQQPLGVVAKSGDGGRGNSFNGGKLVHRDWSYMMGGVAGVGSAGAFPAKYNFDIAAAPSCANDFVVYPASSAGVTGAGNFATVTGTVTGDMGVGTIVTFTNGARTLTLTSSAGSNTGLNFQGNTGTISTNATNLANAINRNGGTVGVSATVSNSTGSWVVTARSLMQGVAGNSIAVGGNVTNVTASGATLAGGSGTSGQPTIFAVNQLYSSCGSATVGAPTLLWSYNTGSGAFVETSPVLSLDGTQVAFIQRSAANVASLVLLKWSALPAPSVAVAPATTVGAPSAPTVMTTATYRACAAPCMVSMPLSGNPNNTNSSPYYFYDTDTMWVGDDSGVLHKFTGIFSGTPTEVIAAPWPVTVAAGRLLSSPVYDAANNLVFVGTVRENSVAPTGGRLHSVNNGTGAVISSGVLSGPNAGSRGVATPPIVDQLAKRVYAFVATDTSAGCGGVACNAVYQFATNVTINGLTAPKVTLGRGDVTTRVMYAGIFDNAYYTSTATSPTGGLFVCGGSAGSARRPTLWRIQITANALGAALAGANITGADTLDTDGGGGVCSPITDIQSGTNNFIFVSVPSQGSQTGCAGACIYMYNIGGATPVTAANWAARNATAGLAATGGTSGIVVDNTSAVGGASQVYFMTLTNPGSAIQASQAALN